MSSVAPAAMSADAALASSAAAETGPLVADGQFQCTKCLSPCTMKGSYAAGAANPMRRVCHGCGATDRSLNRRSKEIAAKKKEGTPLDETDIDVKKDLGKKTPEERAKWYRQESILRKEEAMNNKARRTFSDMKASPTGGFAV